MDFEWDEAKRLANVEKHGLDFLDSIGVFDANHVIASARIVGSELRWCAIGQIDGRHVALIFTRRGTTIRVISLRRARHDERRRYEALFG